MRQISQLKPVLANKLKTIKRALELRIKLNRQVVDLLTNVKTHSDDAPRLKEPLSAHSLKQQLAKAKAVIAECLLAMNKLQMLIAIFPKLDCSAALRLYQDFSELSLAEFHYSISYELRRLPATSS